MRALDDDDSPTKAINHDDVTTTKQHEMKNNNKKSSSSTKNFFTSPRCNSGDDDDNDNNDKNSHNTNYFPSAPFGSEEKRWEWISLQAGSHCQDWSYLSVNGCRIEAKSLGGGMTKYVSHRVRNLHLKLSRWETCLVDWIDVISFHFVNLENLTITIERNTSKNKKGEEKVEKEEEEDQFSQRVRRLYVIYRLPKLKCFDDSVISAEERNFLYPKPIDYETLAKLSIEKTKGRNLQKQREEGTSSTTTSSSSIVVVGYSKHSSSLLMKSLLSFIYWCFVVLPIQIIKMSLASCLSFWLLYMMILNFSLLPSSSQQQEEQYLHRTDISMPVLENSPRIL